ncbi:hypothetical protein BK143_02500 [Paenibacillus peoriae]|nr:hypothetical protein BK143_02500 [Paenibacillus peoriae]
MIKIHNEKLDDLAQIHYEAIKNQIYRDKKQSEDECNSFFLKQGIPYTLNEIITAKVPKLQMIVDNPECDCKILNLFKEMYSKFAHNSNSHIGMTRRRKGVKTYNALTLVESLGIKVCPLCNRNYINNTSRTKYGSKRTCQLDHFYSQSDYPLLAMSFYNLIPVCSSCNHTKSNSSITVSPYSTDEIDHLITFGFNINSLKSADSDEQIEVVVKLHSSIKDNFDVLGLKSLYLNHNDIVFEILEKYRYYNRTKRNELLRDFGGLYSNEESIKKALFGNYADIANFHRKSLSKLTKDIITSIEEQPSDLL